MRLTFFFPNYIRDMVDGSILRDFGQALEGLGFWGVDAVDHITYPWPRGEDRRGLPAGGVHGPSQRPLEPLTYLAALALVTRTLRLRTSIIILPQREPVLVAKQTASIDQISGGRFELGVGAGWLQAEFAALGADFTTRGRRMDEALELINRCWTEEHVSFAGRFYQVDDMSLFPKPRQQPRPPIWIGGSRGELVPSVLRRLGRHGDGWMVIGASDVSHVPEGLRLARAEAKRAGRSVDLQLQLSLDLHGSDWRRTVEQRLATYRELGASVLCLNTIGDPTLTTTADHLARLRDFQNEFAGVLSSN